MSRQAQVWEGWGWECASQGITDMPEWVARAVHPDCRRRDHIWRMLISIQSERLALRSGDRLPKEVMGTSAATMDAADTYLEQQLQSRVADLAYGSAPEDW